MSEHDGEKGRTEDGDRKSEKATTGNTSGFGCFWVVAVVGLLLCLRYFIGEYAPVQEEVRTGTPGVFTLAECEHRGGASSGGKTVCTGTFRSEAGKVLDRSAELYEKNDADGLTRGDSFPARLGKQGITLGEVLRDDAVGDENRFENALGYAGFGVIAVAAVCAGLLGRWWARLPVPARKPVLAAVVVTGLAGVVMWVGGLTAGGGLFV